jgi:protein TonB
MVWVKVNIGANGEVTEAKAARWRLTIENSIENPNYWASKPERAFIDAAETAALEWKFAAPDANTKRAVELMFTFRNFPGAAAGGVQAVAAPGGATVVRVGGNIRPPVKIRTVRAAYPEAARAARVQGVVILEVRLGVDGSVVDTKVVRSIPLLDEAAVDSVRQWRYAPTLLNGEPVEVIMTVTVSFMAS